MYVCIWDPKYINALPLEFLIIAGPMTICNFLQNHSCIQIEKFWYLFEVVRMKWKKDNFTYVIFVMLIFILLFL